MDWDMIMKKFPVLHDYLLGDILTCFLCKKIANLPCSGNICHRLRRFQDICLHFLQYPPLPTHKPTSNNFSVLWLYLDIICLPQVNHFRFHLMFFPSISFLCRSSKGRWPKKTRENVGIFPKSGSPLPPVWEFFPDFTVYFWEVSHVKNSKKNGSGIRVDTPNFFQNSHIFPFFFGRRPLVKH